MQRIIKFPSCTKRERKIGYWETGRPVWDAFDGFTDHKSWFGCTKGEEYVASALRVYFCRSLFCRCKKHIYVLSFLINLISDAIIVYLLNMAIILHIRNRLIMNNWLFKYSQKLSSYLSKYYLKNLKHFVNIIIIKFFEKLFDVYFFSLILKYFRNIFFRKFNCAASLQI